MVVGVDSMKKIITCLLLVLSFFFLTGCSKEEKVISNGKTINTSKMGHKHCTRGGSLEDGEVSLNYDLYYTGDDLNILKSEEKVLSTNSDVLNTYANAYQSIHSNYEGLEYYDTSLVLEDDSVTSIITINYDQINISELLKIEGEDDNIIENGVAKVDKWLTLAKKFGTSCSEVED